MRRLVFVVVALAVMAACGGSATGIGQTASGQLAPEVAQVKAAAVSGDLTTAATRLAQLRASVADLLGRNELSAASAAKVLAAADEVAAQLGVAASGVTTQPSITAVPAPRVTVTTPHGPPTNKGKGKDKT